MISVCRNVPVNLHGVSWLLMMHCKTGKQKFFVAPVALKCSDHLALLVLANLPGILQGLGEPTHTQMGKTSAVL